MFDPNKYGNPLARKIEKGQQVSPSSEKPQQPETPIQATQVVQTWSFEHTSPPRADDSASQLIASDNRIQCTDGQQNISTPPSISQSTPSSKCGVKVQIPGFNPHAYGYPPHRGTPKVSPSPSRPDPTKAVDGNIQSREDGAQESPSIPDENAVVADEEPSVTAEVSENDYAHSEVAVISSSSMCRPRTNEGNHLQHQTTGTSSVMSNAIGTEIQSRSNFSDNAKVTVVIATPQRRQETEPPATYETLKRPGESPQDTLRRLQVAKQREVIISRQQAHDMLGGHTANLAELKNLRRPISPDHSVETPASSSTTPFNAPQLFPAVSQSGIPDPPSPFPLQAAGPLSVRSALTVVNSNVSRRPSPLSQQQEYVNGVDSKHVVDYKSTLLAPWASDHKTTPQNKWAMVGEIKTPVGTTNGKAAGSIASEDSGSMYHMGIGCELGRLGQRQQAGVEPAPIVGWDGQLIPPPVDWEQRLRFSNDHENFNAAFRNWLGETVQNTLGVDAQPRLQFERVPTEVVLDMNLHPDGLGFVRRSVTINAENAKHYGYNIQSDTFLVDVSNVADFDADWRVDTKLPENLPYKDETVNKLIERKMQLIQQDTKRWEEYIKERKASEEQRAESIMQAMEAVVEPPRPKVNLYLRPAVAGDIPGMAAILNWHIQNGVRTSEINPISNADMQLRLDMAKQSKLPFIVAIERTRRNAHHKAARRSVNPNHPIQNTDPSYNGVVKDEHVVGWVSAVDWSCTDYVECISAELELYVAHDYRRKGIGRCLMDTLMDATDPGYMREGGYDFTVAPELSHMYSCGGMRNLHKNIFQVRTYNSPLTLEMQKRREAYLSRYSGIAQGNSSTNTNGKQTTNRGKDKAANANATAAAAAAAAAGADTRIDDLEDDYNLWLKKWLEKFGFQEESCLKKIGTKNRRFLDSHYLTLETRWQPADRKLPDYSQYPI